MRWSEVEVEEVEEVAALCNFLAATFNTNQQP
jgi:hypothetical protein